MPPKPPNRSKYTPEVHEQIVANIRKGYSKDMSFRLVGIRSETGWAWLRQGRQQPDKYPHYVKLAEDIQQAIAEVQAERVDQIIAAAQDPKHWTAAAWYLERTDPATWGRKDRVEVSASEDSAPLVQLNQLVISNKDAQEASRELLRRLAVGIPADEDVVLELPQRPPSSPSET